jgi:hypothetical protein
LQESYKIEGTCFSGTFHFIRFLKFKEFIMLGKEPLFGKLDFQAFIRKITLQIQEDPQRGSLPLYIADTRDANPKRRMVDPWKELLLQKNQHQR